MIARPLTTFSLLLSTALACNGGGGGSTESSTTAASSTGGSSTGPDLTSGTTSTTTNPTSSTTDNTSGDPTTDPTIGPTTMGSTSQTDTTTGEPACPYAPVNGMPSYNVEILATGFDRPVLAVPDPTDSLRLFVVEQGGRVKILEPGANTAPAENFMDLDVKNKVPMQIGPEQGLLGFAFHPNYPTDPRVYVNYNPGMWQGPGPTYVAEFKLDPNDPNKVDPASERLVIAISQPASNHNGGMITFGPDGYLYIGMGDGGGSNDQYDTGRDFTSLHAKLLRIDVEPDGNPDSNDPCQACDMLDGFDYTIPADNPYVGDNNYAPEIWALGFRNPWRFSFDEDGTLYVGDVGQNNYEEVDVVAKGADYGWSLMEANNCFSGNCDDTAPPNGVNSQGLTAPLTEYDHGGGRCSVTGGAVYRGCEVPGWAGTYLYGDYCDGQIRALVWDGNNVQDLGVVASQADRILGFGTTGFGDVLFTVVELDDFNAPVDGKILRVVPQ